MNYIIKINILTDTKSITQIVFFNDLDIMKSNPVNLKIHLILSR